MKALQWRLEDAGYGNFVVSHEPRKAMALLRRELPGLLLLDLMMPEVSGFELLEGVAGLDRIVSSGIPAGLLIVSQGAPFGSLVNVGEFGFDIRDAVSQFLDVHVNTFQS